MRSKTQLTFAQFSSIAIETVSALTDVAADGVETAGGGRTDVADTLTLIYVWQQKQLK